jgi:tRNA A37 threonylcarbamoyladenosine synthetase subunit TsaC/SUA5/YrdC
LGLRIPEHAVVKGLMDSLDVPLIVSSVKNEDANEEYYNDSDELIAQLERQVGFIVTDEASSQEATTIVDMTGGEPVVVRKGATELRM